MLCTSFYLNEQRELLKVGILMKTQTLNQTELNEVVIELFLLSYFLVSWKHFCNLVQCTKKKKIERHRLVLSLWLFLWQDNLSSLLQMKCTKAQETFIPKHRSSLMAPQLYGLGFMNVFYSLFGNNLARSDMKQCSLCWHWEFLCLEYKAGSSALASKFTVC